MRFLQSLMCRDRRSARYPSIWKPDERRGPPAADEAVLQEVERVFPGIPVVLGGDLNTNTFDGRDKAVIRHLRDEPEELAAAIEMIDLYEPLLQDCTAAGYAWRAASGGADCTRRKPLPEGGCLHMSWIGCCRAAYRALQQL